MSTWRVDKYEFKICKLGVMFDYSGTCHGNLIMYWLSFSVASIAQDQPLDRPNIDFVPGPSVADKVLNQGSVNDFIGDGAKLAVKHFIIVNQMSGPLQHGHKGFVVATCQSDELLIGGGFFGNPGIQVSRSLNQFPPAIHGQSLISTLRMFKGTPKHMRYVSHQDDIILSACLSIEVQRTTKLGPFSLQSSSTDVCEV
jgi:hypothetical protein